MIQMMLPHKTKPKCKTMYLTIEDALDILDIDKNPYAYRADKRGAIEVVRNYIKELDEKTPDGEKIVLTRIEKEKK